MKAGQGWEGRPSAHAPISPLLGTCPLFTPPPAARSCSAPSLEVPTATEGPGGWEASALLRAQLCLFDPPRHSHTLTSPPAPPGTRTAPSTAQHPPTHTDRPDHCLSTAKRSLRQCCVKPQLRCGCAEPWELHGLTAPISGAQSPSAAQKEAQRGGTERFSTEPAAPTSCTLTFLASFNRLCRSACCSCILLFHSCTCSSWILYFSSSLSLALSSLRLIFSVSSFSSRSLTWERRFSSSYSTQPRTTGRSSSVHRTELQRCPLHPESKSSEPPQPPTALWGQPLEVSTCSSAPTAPSVSLW